MTRFGRRQIAATARPCLPGGPALRARNSETLPRLRAERLASGHEQRRQGLFRAGHLQIARIGQSKPASQAIEIFVRIAQFRQCAANQRAISFLFCRAPISADKLDQHLRVSPRFAFCDQRMEKRRCRVRCRAEDCEPEPRVRRSLVRKLGKRRQSAAVFQFAECQRCLELDVRVRVGRSVFRTASADAFDRFSNGSLKRSAFCRMRASVSLSARSTSEASNPPKASQQPKSMDSRLRARLRSRHRLQFRNRRTDPAAPAADGAPLCDANHWRSRDSLPGQPS